MRVTCLAALFALHPLTSFAGVADIYAHALEPVDFSAVRPPEGSEAVFLADIQRRTPPLELFPEGASIRVLGIFPEHFSAYAESQRWTFLGPLLWNGTHEKTIRSPEQKTECSQRPTLWKMKDQQEREFLAFATEPSREAVSHWASMLRQLLTMNHRAVAIEALWPKESTRLFVEHTLETSGLLERLREVSQVNHRPANLIVGYTKMADKAMEPLRPNKRTIDCGPYYSLKVWEDAKGSPFVALVVKFNFRGTIGLELASALRKSGSLAGIIFATRVEQDVSASFKGYVIPGKFATLSPEGRLPEVPFETVPLLPGRISRALHVSTPSVLLDPKQITHLTRKGSNSRGTEIAFWAKGARREEEQKGENPSASASGIPFLAIGLTQNSEVAFSVLSGVLEEVLTLDRILVSSIPKKMSSLPTHGRYEGKLLRSHLYKISSTDHTMGQDLVEYYGSKGPPLELLRNLPVQVLGIAPDDLAEYAKLKGWTVRKPLWDGQTRVDRAYLQSYLPSKYGNTQRPTLYEMENEKGETFLLLQTMPSAVLHCGMLIKQYYDSVESYQHEDSSRLFAASVVNESGLLEKLATHSEWTSGQGVLLLGLTKMAAQYLSSAGYRSPYSKRDYEFIEVSRGFSYAVLTKEGHRPVIILNVDFSYWGQLAGDLAEVLLRKGNLYGLIHLAKVGQMVGAESFEHPYIPSSFSVMEPSGEIHAIQSPKPFFEPECLSGDHMSVSSPVLETLQFMERAKVHGSVTVDVEGAYLARAAYGANVRFAGLYYASDYVPTDAISRSQNCGLRLTVSQRIAEDHKIDQVEESILYRLIPALKVR